MTLSATVLRQLRIEVGDAMETGVDDDTTLETFYDDENIGDSNVYLTALAVWRKRLSNMAHGAFDVNTAGQMALRSQKAKHIRGEIARLEFAAGTADDSDRFRATEFEVNSNQELDATVSTSEFS